MKKILTLIIVVVYSVTNFAQDLTSKNGELILPQQKDWSIGIDATKLFKDFTFDFVSSSQALMFKYMKDAKTAYRIGVRIGINDWTTKEREIDRLAATSSVVAFPAAEPTKQNTWKRTSTSWGLSFGMEKRRGTTRLQGIYGAEGGIYVTTLHDKFSYGNALNANPAGRIDITEDDEMTSPIFGAANNVDTFAVQGVIGQGRVIERRHGALISIGARAFVGVEYFLLPKISIGGEFGWGFSVTTNGRTETVVESIGQGNTPGNTQPAVNKTTLDSGNSTIFRLDTDNASMLGGASASLRVNLYF
jgi:hypothetical protein